MDRFAGPKAPTGPGRHDQVFLERPGTGLPVGFGPCQAQQNCWPGSRPTPGLRGSAPDWASNFWCCSAPLTDPEGADDVDLAYLAAKDVPQLDVADAFLERVGDGVDLMDLRLANPIARWEALGPGRILAEQTPGTFAKQQMAAYGEWNDTREFRELALQVMSR